MSESMGRVLWMITVGAAVTVPAAVGQVPIEITGRVGTGTSFTPVTGALVVIGSSKTSWTDQEGEFYLDEVPPGDFVLSVERSGFQTRAFRVHVPDTAAGVIDIGTIWLTGEEASAARLRGTVINARHGQPVPGALIVVGGNVMAISGDDGTFHVDSVASGVHHFELRRVGYVPAIDVLRLEPADTALVQLGLQPLPIRLDDVEIVAEGDRTIYAQGRLAAFYRRRRTSQGTFFSRDDVEKYARVYLTDLFHRVPGVHLRYGSGGRRIPVARGCTARILLDGLPLTGLSLDDIPPSWVEAVEVHRGAAVPVELMAPGRGNCAVGAGPCVVAHRGGALPSRW